MKTHKTVSQAMNQVLAAIDGTFGDVAYLFFKKNNFLYSYLFKDEVCSYFPSRKDIVVFVEKNIQTIFEQYIKNPNQKFWAVDCGRFYVELSQVETGEFISKISFDCRTDEQVLKDIQLEYNVPQDRN